MSFERIREIIFDEFRLVTLVTIWGCGPSRSRLIFDVEFENVSLSSNVQVS